VGHFIGIGGALILIIVGASIVSTFIVNTVQIFRTSRAVCLLTWLLSRIEKFCNNKICQKATARRPVTFLTLNRRIRHRAAMARSLNRFERERYSLPTTDT
jgi:hypothetical protein